MKETPQQYTKRILGYVEGRNPLKVQRETPKKLRRLTKSLSRKQLKTRPAPDRWSIAEILAHLTDAELVGGWRMRLILGSSGAPLQAYDQNVWAERFDYANRDPKDSLKLFRLLRESNLALLKSMPQKLWENYGMHAERGKETLAQIVRLYAGHDLNHLRQVEAITKAGKN
jgi:uncharacterized damage-inducible protein DinB